MICGLIGVQSKQIEDKNDELDAKTVEIGELKQIIQNLRESEQILQDVARGEDQEPRLLDTFKRRVRTTAGEEGPVSGKILNLKSDSDLSLLDLLMEKLEATYIVVTTSMLKVTCRLNIFSAKITVQAGDISRTGDLSRNTY